MTRVNGLRSGIWLAAGVRTPFAKVNGALGHPFGVTGARILSQALKELSNGRPDRYGIVGICTDGGQGAMVLLKSAHRP